ncbi:Na(+)-translocating NADH-quinone reductase subunit F [Sporomusa carbonis]|uniref:ASKHA domain-containing protein n=1 Tax=Sporomusa carbonis TaxID=3076075 RepID=UPI003A78FD0A
MQYTVVFQPAGCRGLVSAGENLLQASRNLGVAIEAPCGGGEICGKCKVIIDSAMSNLSPLSEKERKVLTPAELAGNYRLACCARIYGDVVVFVPEQSRGANQIVLETGRHVALELKPAINLYYVELNKPTLEDFRDDFARLKDALLSRFIQIDKNITIDYRVLLRLPDVLRQSGWKVTVAVWNDTEIIAVAPGSESKAYGIAVDVGTTTIAAYLCDLVTGDVLTQDSMMNNQVRYGDDVISRISYCMMNDDGLSLLQQSVIDDINTLVKRMTGSAGIQPDHVFEIILVFNTVMHHIALKINPQYIGSVPFTSAIRESVTVKAREIGITIAPGGYIHCLPIEAGFVGADNVAVLIAEEPYKQDKMTLIIDIGTNGEINFGNRAGILSASCATGPAFEGAQIKFGMRAAVGAIERVKVDPVTKEPEIKVIGQNTSDHEEIILAKGICGSGIIDAVAELFKAGIIQADGGFNKSIKSPRIRQGPDGKFEYVLVWAAQTTIGQDITITQKDVRAVQLAKAALYAGAKILMQKQGINKVDSVILAGAFGSYIDKENALVLGMFPDCNLEHVVAVGNAAGSGAKLALLNKDKRIEAQVVAQSVQFVETAAETNFQTEFFNAMYLPHAKDSFTHIQHILDKIPQC